MTIKEAHSIISDLREENRLLKFELNQKDVQFEKLRKQAIRFLKYATELKI